LLQVFGVIFIGEEALCENSSIIDQQIDTAERLFNPGISLVDGGFVGDVALDFIKNYFNSTYRNFIIE
jgi:hypothetical protein